MSVTKENSQDQFLTYEKAGVRYDEMDLFKREAQMLAIKTAHNLERFGLREVLQSRGESAYVVDFGDHYLAFVTEGLGTKNKVAEAMRKITGKTYYDQIAQDTIAMMVNDLVTVGADPFLIGQHIDAGDPKWFSDEDQRRDFLRGWQETCYGKALAVWGPGESATLKDVVYPDTATLSGFSVGMIRPKERFVTHEKIEMGDRILLVPSSGIHANYLTAARRIASQLEEGYATKLASGRMYGEVLLDPTHIYASLVRDLQRNNVDIHYMVNITGHGWRKLIRAPRPFEYIIEKVPEPPEIFEFIMENGLVDIGEAYSQMNMGAGFAIFLPEEEVDKTLEIGKVHSFDILDAGYIVPGPAES